jgi:REP element-mobilizing transposase RayT
VVIAYHVIFGIYGFWLPNDPRGSWSDFVGSWELFRYGGPATKVNDRRSHAWDAHDVQARQEMKKHLKYPPVKLSGIQARSIGLGFYHACRNRKFNCYACAILPEHVHLVLGRHHYDVEQIVRILKQQAGLQLKSDAIHPLKDCTGRRGALPSAFGAGMWKCFIDSENYLHAAIQYVKDNPIKEGFKAQDWSFVREIS